MIGGNSISNRKQHALVRVQVTRDRKEATLIIEASEPAPVPAEQQADAQQRPEPPKATPEDIDRALSAAGIHYGVDQTLLARLKSDPQPGEYPIAKALEPESGMNGSLVYHFNQFNQLKPQELADGRVDYRHLGLIQNVRKGDMLCTALPPTEGKPGRDVTGAPITQNKGRPAALPAGENTVQSPDGTILIAALSGQVSMSGSRVSVYPTYTVDGNVDFSTGHIDFVGNVHVCGNVHEGFQVQASGSVEVDGMVDGGSLTAGGNIIIHQGAVGHGSSVFACEGNFVGNFVENCTIRAGGNVTAASMMHCTVVCVKSIQLVGLRARIIGGSYLAGEDITAGSIGSPSGAATELKLGEAPSLIERSRTLEKELETLRARVEKLEEIRSLLESKKGAMKENERQAVLQNSTNTIGEIRKEQLAKEDTLQKVGEQLARAGKGRVAAQGTIYRGTRVTIGFVSETLTETRSQVELRVEQRQDMRSLRITPIASN